MIDKYIYNLSREKDSRLRILFLIRIMLVYKVNGVIFSNGKKYIKNKKKKLVEYRGGKVYEINVKIYI